MWAPYAASLLLLTSLIGAYVVPHPTGKYNVLLTTGSLSDYTREDPDPAMSTPRSLMLSIFEPYRCASTVPVPYMLNKTADFQGPFLQEILDTSLNVTPLFREAQFPVGGSYQNGCQQAEEFPILLFSPGYSIPRLYYNFMASAIASEGFTVITIDHPGDTNFITYRDGYTSVNNDTIQGAMNILARLHLRIADVSLIMDQLSNATAMAELFPSRGPKPFETNHIAMLGHSLGGITAVLAAQQDTRLRGVINWDGNMLEIPSTCGVSQPVLLMSRGIIFDSWEDMWTLLEGPKLWADIANATHFTFSDGQTLLQAAGENLASYEDLLDRIAPEQMVRILVGYTVSWMKGVFTVKGGQSWQDVQDLKFPEVSIIKRGNFEEHEASAKG